MAILPIVTAPDRRLRVRSAPVAIVDEGVRRLMDDMLETMRAAPGIGLSAVQVGVARRIVVVEAPGTETDAETEDGPEAAPRTLCMANPRIVWASAETALYEEGCLSLPDQYAEIERPAEVRVEFLDGEGRGQQEKASGILARCVQHELDHLEGILLVDRLSQVRRNIILRKLSKAKKQKHASAA